MSIASVIYRGYCQGQPLQHIGTAPNFATLVLYEETVFINIFLHNIHILHLGCAVCLNVKRYSVRQRVQVLLITSI